MNSKHFVALFVGAVVCLASTVHAAGLREVKLTQAVASFAFLPISYAKAAGYYEDEGIRLEQIATRGGGPDMNALLAGDVSFNAAAGTYQISALQADRDIINVYNFYNQNLINITLSEEAAAAADASPDDPFMGRVASLRGLTLGMTRPGSLTDRQLRYLGRTGNMEPGSDYSVVAIGGPPNLLAALSQGQIDGFAISVPVNRIAVSRGDGVLWIDNAKGEDPNISPFMMESLLTTPAFAEENPDVVRGLIRATQRAVEQIATQSPRDIRDVVRDEFGKFDPDVMLLGIEAVKPALNRTGEVTLDMARNTLRLYGSTEVTPQELYGTFTDTYLR